jgi:hypothetical protein
MSTTLTRTAIATMVAVALASMAGAAHAADWITAANHGMVAPGGDPLATFRSYNQPSLNEDGVMAFRARSRPDSGAQVDGVYVVDLVSVAPVLKLLLRGDEVPQPNNTDYNGLPASFVEFPSTPRIDPTSTLVASRGQHEPVWTYMLGDAETRVGTSGIYAFADALAPSAPLVAGSLLGAAVEPDQVTPSFPWFAVPGTFAGTRFDQFPGSPAPLDGRYITWKGNFTDMGDGEGRTGIFFRDILGTMPIPYTGLIASSDMVIPNQLPGGTVKFGSTAPPSAAAGHVYFVGYDIEEAPTLGGIYRAPLASTPPLQVLVGVGDQVPGEPPGATFRSFGEGLSVAGDGSRIAFWGTWGSQTVDKTLICPLDGNADRIAYCNQIHPAGLVVQVPVNQGVFVHDVASGVTTRLARTGVEGLEDLMFWNFSGRPPGVGEGDEPALELARWRASAFAALSSSAGGDVQVAFKAQRNGTRGIYLREGIEQQLSLRVVAEVGTTQGQAIDPLAPVDSLVSEVAIERDGFRNGLVAISASMLYVNPLDPEESLSWGGIYAAQLPIEYIFRDGLED